MRRSACGQRERPGPQARNLACMSDQWLSTKDASALLGVQVRQLYQLIDEGRLPAYKIGRLLRLRRDEVLEFRRTLRDDES